MLESAMNLLGKDDVQVLGLYGVGGVGKTTLMKKINNEMSKIKNDFDIVIWVVISSDVNMRTVQEAIGERLGLMPWPERVSLSSRASDLFNALFKVKFLILLDDVWKEINLQSIGIPLPTIQNKSKIVLTTRSLDVCGYMKARNNIEVKSLNKEHSWNLFKERVGLDTLNADPEIPKLAEEVAKKCHGLPIVLITVGASMASKRNPREWKSAISDLNKSIAKFPDMEERVFHLLKFSYDRLPSPTDQVCFLFCSLYPEDKLIVVDDLIEKWIGAGYIGGFEDYEEALNKAYNIIGTLRRTSLLENGLDDMFVKMHDVTRELALWITRECGKEEGKVFMKSGHALIEIPSTHLRPTVVQKVSLIDTDISHLENLPNCPNLSIFFSPKNRCLNHIIDNFFLSMPALKFLDLSDSRITKVPTSICELSELEYLNLSKTNITSLPYEMRNLIKLKFLSFYGTKLLRIIPRGMMINFSNLEILDMQVPKSGESQEEMHEGIDELRYLNQLKVLGISISDFKDLEKFVSNTHLCICTRVLSVSGCKEITLHLNLGHFKQLRVLVIKDSLELKVWLLKFITDNDETAVGLFESLEKMYLINLPKLVISWDMKNLHHAHFKKLYWIALHGCHAMVDLTWLLLIPNLQSLYILNCGGLQEILSSSDENTFSNLKTLRLIDLPNLQSICSMNALPFPSLETLRVRRCPKLMWRKVEAQIQIHGGGENETIKTRFIVQDVLGVSASQ
ncbi:Disease resistance protein rps5 [Thalictrum thalictroides]|uniref:Disease resistance protein rps5 n=1 Tax=Thalictrum thalictroides TaxID=46969 RepID=A0A7J6VNG8_THATH|nr:Disease resistance protein rps5 [Thalictrum thalictroides]